MIFKGNWYQDGVPALNNTHVVETYGSPGGHAKKKPTFFRPTAGQQKTRIAFGGVMRYWNALPFGDKYDWEEWVADRGPWNTRFAGTKPLTRQEAYLNFHMTPQYLGREFRGHPPVQGIPTTGYVQGMRQVDFMEIQMAWLCGGPPFDGTLFSGVTVYQIHPDAIYRPHARRWSQLVHWAYPWPKTEYFGSDTSWRPIIHLEWNVPDLDMIRFLVHHWNEDFNYWLDAWWSEWPW